MGLMADQNSAMLLACRACCRRAATLALYRARSYTPAMNPWAVTPRLGAGGRAANGYMSRRFACRPAGDDVAAVREPWTSHPGAVIRSLVGLKHRPRQLLELSGGKDANERVLVSAAAVCFLTHVLTVQGARPSGRGDRT